MTNSFSRILFYCVAIPVSYLPFRVLYWFSDFLYIICYHLIGYRKEVVRNNLKNSFPELSESEIIIIEKKFYHHFTDFLVESAKSFSISEKEIIKLKMTELGLKNKDLVGKFGSKGYISSLLSGRKPLTLELAKLFHQELHIPAEVFLT